VCVCGRNLHLFLLLLKSVSSVVTVVVGAAISIHCAREQYERVWEREREHGKVSSLVPSHLIFFHSHDANLPSNLIIPSVSPVIVVICNRERGWESKIKVQQKSIIFILAFLIVYVHTEGIFRDTPIKSKIIWSNASYFEFHELTVPAICRDCFKFIACPRGIYEQASKREREREK
jgi:hypothetical protein